MSKKRFSRTRIYIKVGKSKKLSKKCKKCEKALDKWGRL